MARGLAFIGRWSLPIYVLHQPLIIALLWGFSMIQPATLTPPVQSVSQGFVTSCQQSCLGTGSTAARCERYCGCALEQVDTSNMWDAVSATDPTAEQLASLNSVAKLCTASTANSRFASNGLSVSSSPATRACTNARSASRRYCRERGYSRTTSSSN